MDKSFCQCGVGGVSRDGNDLFGLKAAAGQRPDGNGGVAPKQLQRVGTAAYNAGTAGVTPLGHLDQAHGKLRLGHALSVAAGHHILVGLGGDLLAIDHLSGGLQECAQRVLVNVLLLREEPGAGGNIEGIKNILVGGVKNQALLLIERGQRRQRGVVIHVDLAAAAYKNRHAEHRRIGVGPAVQRVGGQDVFIVSVHRNNTIQRRQHTFLHQRTDGQAVQKKHVGRFTGQQTGV